MKKAGISNHYTFKMVVYPDTNYLRISIRTCCWKTWFGAGTSHTQRYLVMTAVKPVIHAKLMNKDLDQYLNSCSLIGHHCTNKTATNLLLLPG